MAQAIKVLIYSTQTLKANLSSNPNSVALLLYDPEGQSFLPSPYLSFLSCDLK